MSLDGTVGHAPTIPVTSQFVISPPTRTSAAGTMGAATALPATASAIAQISPASQLMSKLGQLSERDPAQFKAATSQIASQLAAASAEKKQELTKRVALEAELAHVQQAGATNSSSPSSIPPASSTASSSSALASAFTQASQSGSFGSSAGATALTWTESGLEGALAGALAVVDRALGMSAG